MRKLEDDERRYRKPFPPIIPTVNIPSIWISPYDSVTITSKWEQPCMFDNLPPGVYGLVCPCPRHGGWSGSNVTITYSGNQGVDTK